MKRSIFTKILCLVLCAAICGSLPLYLPATALNVPTGQTGIKADVQALSDLTVMTYNVLASGDNSSTPSAEIRQPYVVDIIKRYSPDIIGFQEACETTSSGTSGENKWCTYLSNTLSDYNFYKIDNTSIMAKAASALVIAVKKDEFTFNSQTYEKISPDQILGIGQERYYKAVNLTHKDSGKTIVITNTHFSVNSDKPFNNTEEGGAELRFAEATALKTYWDTNATGETLLFGMGDYNTTVTRESALTTNKALAHLSSGDFKSAADVALFADKYSSDYEEYIDHIFVKPSVTDVIEHYRVTDTYNNISPSDHKAMIAYVSFKVGFNSGNYDATKRTMTDTVNTRTYTIEPTLLSGFTYTVKDAAGKTVDSTVNLVPGENKYTVTVFNGQTQVGAPINVTITCNDTSLDPTVTATGATAAYYAKGEVRVALPEGTNETTLSFNGAATSYELYKDEACTESQEASITGFTGPRANYYLKVTSSDDSYTVPVKLYHPTATSLPGATLYCDDNWAGLTAGTKVVWDDGTNILIPTIGTTGFGTITEMTDFVNAKKSGNLTGYVAEGTYNDQATINYSFTLLGANHDIDPLVRSDDKWTQNEDRRPESIIHGCINATAVAPITIKGFHFISEQPVNYAAIRTNASSDSGTIVPQIENNIFDHALNTTTNSPIQAIGTAKKAGYIKNNIFRNNPTGRGLTMRNLDGIVISGNYFYNQGTSLYLVSEISNGNKKAGHLSFTLSGNRFENCHAHSDILTNYAVDGATIKVLNNQFISNYSTGLHIELDQATDIENNQTVNFSNTELTIYGNTFKNNPSGIYLYSDNANVKNATINIYQNSISGGSGSALYVNYSGDSTGTFSVNAAYNYLDSASAPVVKNENSNSSIAYTPYYTDAALTTLSNGATLGDITDVTVTDSTYVYDGTAHGITVNGTKAGDSVTYSTDGSNYDLTPPTLTNVGTQTVHVKVSRAGYNDYVGTANIIITKAEVPSDKIQIQNYSVTYDGNAHSIEDVVAPAGATITYSANGTEYSNVKPTFTEVGTYTVYVKVDINNPNYNPYFTTATVTIIGLPLEGISVLPYFGKFDGESHNVTVNGLKEGDTVTYSVDGGDFVETPTISTEGSHDVRVKVQRKNCQDLVVLSRVTLVDSKDGNILTMITRNPTIESGDAYSVLWTLMVNPSESFEFAGEDINFISYGMIYSNDQDNLEQYAEQGALGTIPDIKNVNRYLYDGSDTDGTYLNKVYKTYKHRIMNAKEGRERCAMAFIRFQYNQKLYEVYSPITDGSVILGGTVSGTGDTITHPDTLVD